PPPAGRELEAGQRLERHHVGPPEATHVAHDPLDGGVVQHLPQPRAQERHVPGADPSPDRPHDRARGGRAVAPPRSPGLVTTSHAPPSVLPPPAPTGARRRTHRVRPSTSAN